MTFRKFELFRLDKNGVLPEGLSDRLTAPKGVDLSEPLLKPFLTKEVKLPVIDIIVLDLQNFYIELIQEKNPFCVFDECEGMYLSKEHCWSVGEIVNDALEKLRKQYNFRNSEVIMVPETPKYKIFLV